MMARAPALDSVVGETGTGRASQAVRAARPRRSLDGEDKTRRGQAGIEGARRPLVIGLLNNMPDAALLATESQFRRRLEAAMGEASFRLELFAMSEIKRSAPTRALLERRYAPVDALTGRRLDALIVTGAEPRAPDLRDEPFWPAMTEVIDWARSNTASTLFSCLAAHAAVLHLDGIQRRPLVRKCSGVFEIERAAPHPLTASSHAALLVPHSRLNTLNEGDLAERGYEVLTRSKAAGVDAFVRDEASLMVFLQGHPEYDAETLWLEYRRDLRRWRAAAAGPRPSVPQAYFDLETAQALEALEAEAPAAPQGGIAALIEAASAPPAHAPWTAWSDALFGNWLGLIAARTANGSGP
jgi:homoserine O-succinyltransferase